MQVRKTADMPPEDFAEHMRLRHNEGGELGGLTRLSRYAADRDRDPWERYHEYLHRTKEYDHEH